MIKRYFILYLVLILVPMEAFTKSLSSKTRNNLISKFQLYLESDGSTISWSEIEGEYLFRFLAELPAGLTENSGKIVVYKKKKDFREYVEDGLKDENNTISIFTVSDIESYKTDDESQKENSAFVIEKGLIIPSDIKNQSLYLSYLARGVIKRYLTNYDRKYKISEEKEWRKISRWERTSLLKIPVPFAGMTAENVYIKGFAHPLGQKNPKLDFVTFGACFFAPPLTLYSESIKCRTPEKYRFFREQFKEYKAYLDNTEFERRGISCESSDDDLIKSFEFQDIHTGEKVNIGPLNSKTVKGFELIYATPGDREISEIAGHLMLRVKLDNNPESQDGENPYDLIIAVLADNKDLKENPENKKTKSNVDPCSKDYKKESIQFHELFNSTTEALSGLSGGFRTIFQIDTFQYAQNHYTISGNRTLERYELILNENQKIRLIEHIRTAVKNFKTRYYFFNRNCGSILVKLIGEALDDEEIGSYNTFVSPPNSLLSYLMKRGLIKPVFPKIYSYTAKAQIATDIIDSKIKALKEKHSSINFPSYNDLNSSYDEKRMDAITNLYKIALTEPETVDEIITILKLTQISELSHTWNEGLCIQYSTKTKGVARSFIDELEKLNNTKNSIDITELVKREDLKKEAEDYTKGTSHTGLAPLMTGFKSRKTDNKRDENVFYIGSSFYSQEMGDISNMSLLRGTEVKLGRFEINYGEDIRGYSFTALKIRKIKERRDYVPSVFSINRKFGIGFTLLNFDNKFDDEKYFIKPGEIEGFVSLCSSRLFIDYIIAGIGLSVETEADGDKSPFAELFNESTSAGFPLRLEGQVTFGEHRYMKLNLGIEYKPYLLISGDNSYNSPENRLNLNSSMDIRLGEYLDTEVILNYSYSYSALTREDKNETKDERVGLGLTFLMW